MTMFDPRASRDAEETLSEELLEGTPKEGLDHPYSKRAYSALAEAFWRKQDAAREKLMREGGESLVKARTIKLLR